MIGWDNLHYRVLFNFSFSNLFTINMELIYGSLAKTVQTVHCTKSKSLTCIKMASLQGTICSFGAFAQRRYDILRHLCPQYDPMSPTRWCARVSIRLSAVVICQNKSHHDTLSLMMDECRLFDLFPNWQNSLPLPNCK